MPRNWNAGTYPAAWPWDDATDPDNVLRMSGSGREDRPEVALQEVQRQESQSRTQDP